MFVILSPDACASFEAQAGCQSERLERVEVPGVLVLVLAVAAES